MGKGAPKPPGSTQPQAERGLHIQSSNSGDAIPLRYGENRMAGHVLWAGFFKAIKVPLGAQSGKKTGGGQAAYQYTYTVSATIDLGEGDLPFDRDGNPYNPQRPPELNNIGLARPGRQALSVHETGLTQQAVGQDRFVDGGTVPTNPDGTPKLQPKRGTEPGTWRGKNVRHMGLVAHPDTSAFKGTHWHEFGVLVPAPSPPGRYIAMPGDDFPPFYEGGQHDKLVTPGTRHYAPERYPGLSPLAYRNMPLGANASLPGWNWPYTRMRYAEWVLPFGHDGPGLFVPGSGTASGIRDCAPDHILADFLGSWKHGAGFDELLAMFPGFDPALGDASPFWQEGPESWGNYCRAQECLLSPFYDAQQAASQMLEDLALLTDAAPLFSEGLFKMIPYGDQEQTGPVTGVTYAPVTDPLQYTTGANVGVLPFTMDDFLADGPAKDDPVVVVRKAVLADGRTSAGYFNAIRVEYVDRLNAYAKTIAEARDEAAIAAHGLVVGQPLTANGVTNLALANDIARRYLQRVGQLRDEYRFTVGWQHMLMEPMDVRTIPGEALDPSLAGNLITIRVREINENDKGELEVLAQLFHAPLLGTVPATVPDGSNPVESGTGPGGGPTPIYPWSLAVDLDHNVYLADPQTDMDRLDNAKVRKYGPDGTFLAEWGAPAPGETFEEGSGGKAWLGIAVDAAGYVYSAFPTGPDGQLIHKYSATGIPQLVWGTVGTGGGHLLSPEAVCVTPRGAAEVFVTNIGSLGAGTDQVTVFTPEGIFLRAIPTGANFLPHSLITDGTYVYVTDHTNGVHHAVKKFTIAGTFVTSWGPGGSGDGEFNGAGQPGVDASGSFLYVPDIANFRIQKWTTGGTFVKAWHVIGPGGFGAGSGGAGTGGAGGAGSGELMEPIGVAVDGDRVYVAVFRIPPAGVGVPAFDEPGGPPGLVLIYDTDGNLLGQFAP